MQAQSESQWTSLTFTDSSLVCIFELISSIWKYTQKPTEEAVNTTEPYSHTALKRVALLFGLVFSTSLLLVACGGGNSDTPSATSITSTSEGKKEALAVPSTWIPRGYQVINGITVPPEPSPIVNNSTLAGVDLNKNGVRDDVERVIAMEFGSVARKYAEAISFAKAEQTLLIAPSQNATVAYIKLVDCSKMSADELDKVTIANLNTQARARAYAMSTAGVSGGSCK